MSLAGFKDLREHVGHDIVCVTYGPTPEDPWNVALECETCGCVLLDYEADRENE
jgi:hypothetical protein